MEFGYDVIVLGTGLKVYNNSGVLSVDDLKAACLRGSCRRLILRPIGELPAIFQMAQVIFIFIRNFSILMLLLINDVFGAVAKLLDNSIDEIQNGHLCHHR